MQNSSKINTVRDFAVDHPDLIFISADPTTDELFVTYKGKAVYGMFEGGVVARALTPESFKTTWQEFSDTIATAADLDTDKGAKFMNGILDGIQGIGEALSTKTKPHGKSKEGAKGGSTRSTKGGKGKRTK
jgi:hypothetical protein